MRQSQYAGSASTPEAARSLMFRVLPSACRSSNRLPTGSQRQNARCPALQIHCEARCILETSGDSQFALAPRPRASWAWCPFGTRKAGQRAGWQRAEKCRAPNLRREGEREILKPELRSDAFSFNAFVTTSRGQIPVFFGSTTWPINNHSVHPFMAGHSESKGEFRL